MPTNTLDSQKLVHSWVVKDILYKIIVVLITSTSNSKGHGAKIPDISPHLSIRVLISMFLMLSSNRAPAKLFHRKCSLGLFPSLNLQHQVTDNFPLGMTIKPVIHSLSKEYASF